MSADWRGANIPQWARKAAQEEIDQWRLRAALAWPTEEKPHPLPFWWDDLDVITGRATLNGSPYAGTFWAVHKRALSMQRFSLTLVENLNQKDRADLGEVGERNWSFRIGTSHKWDIIPVTGQLFEWQAEARLYLRWLMCDNFARQLMMVMGGENE